MPSSGVRRASGYTILGLLVVIGFIVLDRLKPRHRRVPVQLLSAGDVLYPEQDEVLVLFADHMRCSSEEARRRLVLPDRLLAALNRPEQYAGYEDADLATQAAVLAHGIVKNHAFDDGNKRTALVTMVMFLKLNGLQLPTRISQTERMDWMLRLERNHPLEELAIRLREVLEPLS
jgi:death-on-curing family protein